MSQYATASRTARYSRQCRNMRHCRLRNSNSDVLKDLARWVRRSTKERANGKQSSPRREDYSPGRRKGLHWLAQIRTFAISQREEFSLFTSKFESDMPSHGVRSLRWDFPVCDGSVWCQYHRLLPGRNEDEVLRSAPVLHRFKYAAVLAGLPEELRRAYRDEPPMASGLHQMSSHACRPEWIHSQIIGSLGGGDIPPREPKDDGCTPAR